MHPAERKQNLQRLQRELKHLKEEPVPGVHATVRIMCGCRSTAQQKEHKAQLPAPPVLCAAPATTPTFNLAPLRLMQWLQLNVCYDCVLDQ